MLLCVSHWILIRTAFTRNAATTETCVTCPVLFPYKSHSVWDHYTKQRKHTGTVMLHAHFLTCFASCFRINMNDHSYAPWLTHSILCIHVKVTQNTVSVFNLWIPMSCKCCVFCILTHEIKCILLFHAEQHCYYKYKMVVDQYDYCYITYRNGVVIVNAIYKLHIEWWKDWQRKHVNYMNCCRIFPSNSHISSQAHPCSRMLFMTLGGWVQ
jgi:hypothetical protein